MTRGPKRGSTWSPERRAAFEAKRQGKDRQAAEQVVQALAETQAVRPIEPIEGRGEIVEGKMVIDA